MQAGEFQASQFITMKRIEAMVLAIAGLTAVMVIHFLVPQTSRQVDQTEAEQVEAANQIYYARIFERCNGVPELKEFVSHFRPTEALEFFESKTLSEVVSVACVCKFDEHFEASFVAPVTINRSGTYSLTGDLFISIKDDNGKFRKVSESGHAEGNSNQNECS